MQPRIVSTRYALMHPSAGLPYRMPRRITYTGGGGGGGGRTGPMVGECFASTMFCKTSRAPWALIFLVKSGTLRARPRQHRARIGRGNSTCILFSDLGTARGSTSMTPLRHFSWGLQINFAGYAIARNASSTSKDGIHISFVRRQSEDKMKIADNKHFVKSYFV